MTLEPAIDIAQQLKQALRKALEEARSEQLVLRSLDSKALLRRAATRDAFNAYAAHLSERLGKALETVGQSLGLREVRLQTLAEAAPEPTARFGAELSEIRALAAALHRQDKVNRHLAERALRCLQAYTRTVRPSAQAYTRGGSRSVESFATQSQRA